MLISPESISRNINVTPMTSQFMSDTFSTRRVSCLCCSLSPTWPSVQLTCLCWTVALLCPTSPLSFPPNRPPVSSCWSSDTIIPPLFQPPLSRRSSTSWRRSRLTPRWQEMAICAARFSLLPTIGFSPPTPPFLHARNGSQIISSTFSAVRQLLSPLVTSSAPFHRSPFVFEWTFLCYRRSPHSRSHRCTASVIRRLTSLLPPLCNTQSGESSFCCRSAVALSAHQGAIVLVVRGRREGGQEDGGWVWGPCFLSVCSSRTGFIEWEEPSVIRLHALFVSPSSLSLSALLLIIRPTGTVSDVCASARICVCVC